MNESQSRVIAYLLVTVVNGLPTQAIAIPTDKTGEATESFSVTSPASVEDPMAQVTSVSQLRDVQPTDWAFSALQSLVERYGCIAGYPDGTYRGDRPLSRYEFAAGLNACLDRVNEFIATATSDLVTREDYMVYLNFPDLFAKGNLGGIYFGQPPKITSSDLPLGNNVPDYINTGLGRPGSQPGTTHHLEAFYRFRVTDNISVTPGIIHIWEPGHTPDSDSITIGVLRTSFTF
ncbi:iron uptake porin [Fischerella thermalis]|uniref:SLH domain-containing protein n=1 Tax=Fischerella thermalis CCMEE 5318 TaxID=2019666 RepID=A0A2N6LL37_9CYAN|nr:iron uptake porin [Fischerella thermalis]PMB25640.1 hypothetical protein CEN46_05210 [Fischerella thermalis CCMEE 5318]